MYGIGSVELDGEPLGYIEKDSWEWNGEKGSRVDVEAEQVPDQPVLVLRETGAVLRPTFNLIELDYGTLERALGGERRVDGALSAHSGGTLTAHSGAVLTGAGGGREAWECGTGVAWACGEWTIRLVSGQVVTIPKGLLRANLGGRLSLGEVSRLECELAVMLPDEGGAAWRVDG